jgi:hypothetical protein
METIPEIRARHRQELREAIRAAIIANPHLPLKKLAAITETPQGQMFRLAKEYGINHKRGWGSPSHKVNLARKAANNG